MSFLFTSTQIRVKYMSVKTMSEENKNLKYDESRFTYEDGHKKASYCIVIGRKEENVIQLTFDEEGKFYIGRHHQDCFKSRYVSRTHCYIQKEKDGRYLLFASKDSKEDLNYNGTFIEKNGTRLETLEYGKGYLLEDGCKFYVTLDIPVTFKKYSKK